LACHNNDKAAVAKHYCNSPKLQRSRFVVTIFGLICGDKSQKLTQAVCKQYLAWSCKRLIWIFYLEIWLACWAPTGLDVLKAAKPDSEAALGQLRRLSLVCQSLCLPLLFRDETFNAAALCFGIRSRNCIDRSQQSGWRACHGPYAALVQSWKVTAHGNSAEMRRLLPAKAFLTIRNNWELEHRSRRITTSSESSDFEPEFPETKIRSIHSG
jgi:hypothetical protein